MSGRWCTAGIVAAVVALVAGIAPALAQGVRPTEVIADLSSNEIAITTGFAGASLLLFGAVSGPGDIVVVVRGPKREEVVRRKDRVAGIWINVESHRFADVPAFVRVISTRPLADIAPEAVLAAREIGLEHLDIKPADAGAGSMPGAASDAEIARFRAGLQRAKQRAGLYAQEPDGVRVLGDRLFRAKLDFPSSVPTGTYVADVYLFQDMRLVSHYSTPIYVRKVGLEAAVYAFAHEQAVLHGIVAIVIALMAGWLAGLIFRKA